MEHENRNITNAACLIITILVTALFAGVWIISYNHIVFRTHQEEGYVFSVLIWLILYLKFGKVYSSFKIASNSIGEIAFSQFLAFSFSNLVLYIAGCLVARKYINIWPGALTDVLQIFVGLVWATYSKQYFLKHVDPQKCLLLYDSNISDVEHEHGKKFAEKLESKYGHLFDITERYPVEDFNACMQIIDQYPIVFIYNISPDKRNKVIGYCIHQNKRMYVTPTLEDVFACGYQVKHFIDTPIMASNRSASTIQTYFSKRIWDIIFATFLLILFSPIMLVTAVAIKVEDHGTILFKQKRVGGGGKVFNILKFRSMCMDAEKDGKPRPAVEGDPRITKVGRFIRKTRIDELPQLFNIFKGDLSLVGPRPERVEHVELYTKEIPEFSYRLRVPAGLTGYAQIYGKYNTSAKDKLLLDLLYIEQQSFIMDAKMVFLTIKTVFTPESTEGFDEEKSEEINQQVNDAENKVEG